MLSINTNLSSLIAQSSLKTSTNRLNQAVERMTTGFKINHAKDNAANYSIATDMSTKINSYMVAEDNTVMGLDMLTTASESLSQVETALLRLRNLAMQSSSGVLGEQSKKAINMEANSLVDEIQRIQSTTEYNGVNILETGTTFLKDVTKVDTTGMTAMSEVDESQQLAQGEYTISSADDLAKLARMQNDGKIVAGSKFVQTTDIDLIAYASGEGWTPIGSSDYSKAFAGEYNGNGYTISNLYINRPSTSFQGLFGTAVGATIKNVSIVSGSIVGKGNTGALIGAIPYTASYISNCNSSIDINATFTNIGGLVGSFIGEIEYSYSTGNVTTTGGDWATGGLIGNGKIQKITNCYATGDVTGIKVCGGLAGVLCGSGPLIIENCYATGKVTALDGAGGFVGGISENQTISMANCYSTGNVHMKDSTLTDVWGASFIAGFTLSINGLIKNCYSTGNIICENDDCKIGGFALTQTSNITIEDCYTTGEIEVTTVSAMTKQEDFLLSLNGATPTINNSSLITDNRVPFTLNFNYSNERKNISFQVGINSDNASSININTSLENLFLDYFRDIGLKTGDYLSRIDDSLSVISTKQTEYGAVQNRLESVLEEITIQRDNLISSRSTIRDADIADESSRYIQQQILQQASATLLATANQSPSIALQLI